MVVTMFHAFNRLTTFSIMIHAIQLKGFTGIGQRRAGRSGADLIFKERSQTHWMAGGPLISCLSFTQNLKSRPVRQGKGSQVRIKFPWRRFDVAGLVALILGSLLVSPAAFSQVDFSNQTIEWIVPFREGGGADIWARFNAPYLAKHLPGNPEVVISA